MARTDSYRRQHDELVEIVTEISGKLDSLRLSKDATEVRTLLSKLMGILKIHLAMEDKSLYPQLLKSPDPVARKLAQKFIDEMGAIGTVVEKYVATWPNALSIQKDANGFIIETRKLFDALGKRIIRENNELYKFVDQL